MSLHRRAALSWMVGCAIAAGPWAGLLAEDRGPALIVAEQKPREKKAEKRIAGLIGTALKNGAATGIAYHYSHGDVFPAELIRERFHDGEGVFPSVQIELVGFVKVRKEMKVEIFHAAGGVNLDHGTLFIDDRQMSQVGDDLAKRVVFSLTLPAGIHKVRWVLTGGTFQTNLLRIQNAKSGKLLRLFHTPEQREATGAAKAVKTIEAQGFVDGWPAFESKEWNRVSTE